MKISIVMPVYNVSEYLPKAIDSVLKQTFKDFELLLIDDGSKDDSGKICDEYAKKDSRITVFHKENGGLSSARNYGIEHAKAEFIGFIDSDDFISENMYERLYEAITSNSAGMSMCRVLDCYGGVIPKFEPSNKVEVYTREEAMKEILIAEKASVWAVNKLYKKSLFDNVRYPVGKITEDGFVILDLLSQCSRVVLVNDAVYYYIHRENSITTTKFSAKNYNTIEAWERNYEIVRENFPSVEYEAKMRVIWAYFNVLDKMIDLSDPEDIKKRREIIKYIRSNFSFIMKCPYFHKSRKLSTVVLMVSGGLYRKLIAFK